VRDRPGAKILELTDVRRTYGSGELSVDALRGVTFIVHEGEFVAIMGASGSGKTTLLGILGCLDRPTSGTCQLVGQEISKLSEAKRARVRGAEIGFVFQTYNLLPRSTAYKNVELPLVYARVPLRERRRRVLDALAEVGLSDRVSHLPTQLSGGQQQRTAIARALVAQPSVVLADEPTGNLDSASADEVLSVMERLNRNGTTIVLVTHSGEVAGRAARILRMSDGLLVSDEPVHARPAVGTRA